MYSLLVNSKLTAKLMWKMCTILSTGYISKNVVEKFYEKSSKR
ncbi:hypothetical protein DF16_orf01589 [Bacillus thuringiensis serovar kurstaki str. YBT-1520]|nr:hypothetical protein DF16_orf01589 [Bacillus thuringiensis serovar kurstaki str. YBT-1520]